MNDTSLSAIGGAANSGSAKPPQELEKEERQQPGRDDSGPGAQREADAGITPTPPQTGPSSERDAVKPRS